MPTGPNPADRYSEEKVRYASNFIHVKSAPIAPRRVGKAEPALCFCLWVTEIEREIYFKNKTRKPKPHRHHVGSLNQDPGCQPLTSCSLFPTTSCQSPAVLEAQGP